jgi:hypothetical protein
VTLRSTFKLVNLTMYPLELTLVDDSGQHLYPIEKLGALAPRQGQLCVHNHCQSAPQQDYAVPIEAAMKNRVRIQPDRESPDPEANPEILILSQKDSNSSGHHLFVGRISWRNRHKLSNAIIQMPMKLHSASRLLSTSTLTTLYIGLFPTSVVM